MNLALSYEIKEDHDGEDFTYQVVLYLGTRWIWESELFKYRIDHFDAEHFIAERLKEVLHE